MFAINFNLEGLGKVLDITVFLEQRLKFISTLFNTCDALQLAFLKLLFSRLHGVQNNFGLWLTEPKLVRTQIIFLQAAQLPAIMT